ncbi:DUF6083 domain-containing protein [Streptomyces daghestanicus]|uniref:Uncharacterized protein n=1 Tax=Streptomyces daghestanicus TaxID=66885 RepID=A0ABQ3Q7I9_9ACTN|nr:DUF6083 domain-containing protein [Streptomyces daghestanicus]GGU69084.1 hypothetical protein GCM10010259_68670 [Streptomyces daghestanicus]GHI33253.1 hypothetical protein Sdagh_49830 [Streptomyces daghestanicus]
MGLIEERPRRIGTGQSACPYCGLPQDRAVTLDGDWVLLEPRVRVLAHLVPAEHRWIELSDGRVTVYGTFPAARDQQCRIEHRLGCPRQALPDLWPWLTALRAENGLAADRRGEEPPSEPPAALPNVG